MLSFSLFIHRISIISVETETIYVAQASYKYILSILSLFWLYLDLIRSRKSKPSAAFVSIGF